MPDNERASRRIAARQIRTDAAQIAFSRPHPPHVHNGDETHVTDGAGALNFAGNHSKGLLHDVGTGDVDRGAYGSLLQALAAGTSRAFEQVQLGTLLPRRRKLVNPQAGLAFDTEGPDAQEPTLPPAPNFGSAEEAAEAAELYWMAVLRDVPFSGYTGTNVEVAAAALSLSDPSAGGEFSFETSPRIAGSVTPATLFRGSLPGDDVGPYVSQFLLQGTIGPCTPPGGTAAAQQRADGFIGGYGGQRYDQRILAPAPGQNFLVNRQDWLDSQNAIPPNQSIAPDCTPRFIRNLRDLAFHVRADRNYQHYLNAAVILQNIDPFAPSIPDRGPINLPLRNGSLDGTDPGNPYSTYTTQEGFATFGDWHVLELLAEVTRRALTAAWYQKFFVHRRLRPEEFGGRVDNVIDARAIYQPPPHASIIHSLSGPGGQLNAFYGAAPPLPPPRFNDHLLPQAFPEGSPLHSAYPSGHATVAGACVTILKAWFDDERPLSDFGIAAMEPNATGTALVAAPTSFPVTHLLAHELNKLASNVSLGRNAAGIHWRSDYYRRGLMRASYASYDVYLADTQTDLGGIALGEKVAIRLLQEQAITYNEERREAGPPDRFEPFFFTFRDFRNQRLRVSGLGQVELLP
jgi:membrane-associated phospholipid phosphatase